VPPRAYRDEPYAADPRPAYWRLEGFRAALTVVGLIALIAAGLAVWALIRADHNRSVVVRGASVTPAGMVALTRRVDNLGATVRSLRSLGGSHVANAQSLAARIASLQQSENQLASQVKHAGSSGANPAQVSQLASKEAALSGKVSQWVGKEAALTGQVSQLQGRVAQLAGQVAQLKGQSANQNNSTGTGTSTVP
jgi:outer membrane murein-binding lipoprotein Lpp